MCFAANDHRPVSVFHISCAILKAKAPVRVEHCEPGLDL